MNTAAADKTSQREAALIKTTTEINTGQVLALEKRVSPSRWAARRGSAENEKRKRRDRGAWFKMGG